MSEVRGAASVLAEQVPTITGILTGDSRDQGCSRTSIQAATSACPDHGHTVMSQLTLRLREA